MIPTLQKEGANSQKPVVCTLAQDPEYLTTHSKISVKTLPKSVVPCWERSKHICAYNNKSIHIEKREG